MTPKLGPYTNDPRVVPETDHIRVPSRDAEIVSGNGTRWWVRIGGQNTMSGTVVKCLEDLLGDPMRVGPAGIREWMHTDGRTYRHDPATTGMIQAGSLHVGDIVDFPHLEAFEILSEQVSTRNELGEWNMAYPVRTMVTRTATTFSPRSEDMIPIRFAR